jgi:glutamyl-tRNA reductase
MQMLTVQGCTLDLPPSLERADLVRQLRERRTPMLVLDTCQRLEVFGTPDEDDPMLPVQTRCRDCSAFERLARIAAGLESRILGELEVLGQVRAAYKEFRARAGDDDRLLDRFVQDALALARKARRESGIDRQMTSLSGLAGREILNRVASGGPIAVIGAGSLAAAVIRHLGKRGQSPIRVSSRCPDNAMLLAHEVGGFGSGLAELAYLLRGVEGIVTATAAPHPVVYRQHLDRAAPVIHIVDLGVPPDCHEDVREDPRVAYIGLEGIEDKARGNAAEREQRARMAAAIIRDGAVAWSRRR